MNTAASEMRVLVSGSGSIGRRHMRNLRALGIRDLAACDPNPERLEPMVNDLRVQAFADFDQALEQFRPDAVFICNPPIFHVMQARRALAAKAHVFIEKPLSHSRDGVRQLELEVRGSALIVQVGYNLRFHPAIRKLKQIVNENAIGQILLARLEVAQYLPDWRPWQDYRQSYTANRDLGGGIILDGSHELDYLIWLLGEPDGVLCMAGTVGRLQVDVEDSANILLHFPCGAQADVHLDFLQRVPARSCKLVGERGTAIWENTTPQTVKVLLADAEPQSWQFDFDANDMYMDEVKDFFACIREQRQPVVDVEQAALVLEWAIAAKEAGTTQAWSSVIG